MHASRLTRTVTLAILVLVMVAAVFAPLTALAEATANWRGEYYNNVNLAGSPALVRTDAQVNFDWGTSAPAAGVDSDHFGVRWTAFVSFGGGNYTFYATSDDGVRVWVDEQLLIDQWFDHPATTYSAAKYLTAGYHSLRVEHYENSGQAVCKMWWDLAGSGGSPITEWRGEYYNNTWLGGVPALVRNDATVYFDWGYGAPGTAVGSDNFSARWTRSVYFDSSTNYTFSATVDDGVRVWVDGALVIDKWYPQSRTTHNGTLYVTAGNHQVKVEYFEQTGVATCMVSWAGGSSGTVPPTSTNEVIVDNRDAGFVWGGPSSGFYSRNTGYRGHLYWTWNSNQQLSNWAKWTPNLTVAGDWEVLVYIPDRYHGSKSARYTVRHAGVSHEKVVNQNIYANQWVSMGTYSFAATSDEYVYLGDNTGEVYGTRFVGFDAVKFVYRGGSTPQPTPIPGSCSIMPQHGFGRVWSTYGTVQAKLGCPTANEMGLWLGEQTFQGGYMFWRQDDTYIYVLYNNGTWRGYDDTWTSAEPEWDTMIFPPAGYYQPKRGFGKVWRGNQDVRNGLQWGTIEERGFFGSLQTYNGGLMLWSNVRGIFVLYNDGTWARYN
jgi:hypothetical protein